MTILFELLFMFGALEMVLFVAFLMAIGLIGVLYFVDCIFNTHYKKRFCNWLFNEP